MSLEDPSAAALVLGELDELILKKLSDANMVLYADRVKPFNANSTIQSFKDEMASRHIMTVCYVSQFCLKPIGNIYLNCEQLDQSLIPHEYLFLMLALRGWTQGLTAANKDVEVKLCMPSPHCRALNELFSPGIFEDMQKMVPKLVKDFFAAIDDCTTDLYKDRSTEKSQIDLLMDFAEAFVKAPAGEEHEAREIAKKIQKPAMMNYFCKTKMEEILGTPCEKLFVAFQRLLFYFDVLHHAGWLNISQEDKRDKFKWFQVHN